jgi:hypothetical protein
METRLTSMKYQLNAEEVRMRMRLKKTTNFVRILASFPAASREGSMRAD